MRVLSILVSSVLMLVGCQQLDRPFYNTRDVLDFDNSIKEEKSDVIRAYAISTSEPNTLVVFGDNYDYVLTMSDDLANLLRSPLLSKLNAYVGKGYYIEAKNQFNTPLYLNIKQSTLNASEQKLVNNLGFKLDERETGSVYKLTENLTGKLYQANQSNQKYLNKSNYKETIRFTVQRPMNGAAKVFSLLVSPIFLAKDVVELGAVGGAYVAGYTIAAPVMLIDKLTTKEEKSK